MTLTEKLLNNVKTITENNTLLKQSFLHEKMSISGLNSNCSTARILNALTDTVVIPKHTSNIETTVIGNSIEIAFFSDAFRHYDDPDFISSVFVVWTANNMLTVIVSDIVAKAIPQVITKLQKHREYERAKQAVIDEKLAMTAELFPAL